VKRKSPVTAGVLATALLAAVAPTALAQQQGATPPAATGADVPTSYFGPPPSEIDRELVGPVQLLRSGKLDRKRGTIRLPLYLGHMRDGRNVWYVLTDTTDRDNAEALGLNHSAKLAYSQVGRAVREGELDRKAGLVFDAGAVDFGPRRALRPGPRARPFPPAVAEPGSVGDAEYTPLVRIANAGGHIYNAPVVAFDKSAAQISACRGNVDHSLVHDRVLKICPAGNGGGTVTIKLTTIFSFGRAAQYMSTEASDRVVATLDRGTFTPTMNDLPVGDDDSAFSAVERLFVMINGPTGRRNPQRQGLNSALVDQLDPLHVIGGIPTLALDYSPLWDINLGRWTLDAVRRGYRSRLIDEFQLLEFVRRGHITGPAGARYGSVGIRVNCPIVHRFL